MTSTGDAAQSNSVLASEEAKNAKDLMHNWRTPLTMALQGLELDSPPGFFSLSGQRSPPENHRFGRWLFPLLYAAGTTSPNFHKSDARVPKESNRSA